MNKFQKQILLAGSALLIGSTVMAKLPAPSDEAKAKAAEAAAKTAWSGKVEGYLLCKSQDKAAAHYKKTQAGGKDAKAAGKDAKPAAAASSCADPGPFVYTPVAAPAAPAAAPVAVAPAAAAATPAKKP